MSKPGKIGTSSNEPGQALSYQRYLSMSTRPSKLRIGIIGAGNIVKSRHLPALRQMPDVSVVAVCNSTYESAEAFCREFAPEAVPGLAERLAALQHLQVRGLMTMAAYGEEPQRSRPTFAALRALRDQLQQRLGSSPQLDHLSMGMTNDFEVAIEEGATLVRIGTALFGSLLC